MPEPSPDDLLTLAEARDLVPSPRPGCRTHLATLYRWVLSGRLPAVRRGRWYFVRRADLLKIATPVPVQASAKTPRLSPRLLAARKRRIDAQAKALGLE